jgi:bifunctional DNase/RNase
VTVDRLAVDRTTNTPVVLLRESVGNRGVSIWIGPPEASAIAIALQGVNVPRPMTHDLLRHLLKGLGGELVQVAITMVLDNTYHAELLVRRGSDEIAAIDSRPSDAIALALRCEAPILVAESLLRDLGAEPAGETQTLSADALRQHLERLDPQDFGRFVP